jgi:small redox-active disulfide protein 2
MDNGNDKPIERTLRVGKVTIGLIGIDQALLKILSRDELTEEQAVDRLMEEVSRQNYIPEGSEGLYREALAKEYRKLKKGETEVRKDLSIRILGPACVSCNRLNTMTFDILQEMGIPADIEQIHELDEIWRHGVITTPALIINGEIKSSGRLPTRSEVEEWFREFLK